VRVGEKVRDKIYIEGKIEKIRERNWYRDREGERYRGREGQRYGEREREGGRKT